MTIEESIQVLCANVMVAVDRADMGEACSKMVEDALNVAIASLEAWREVKAEIEDYKEKYIKLHRDWDATMIQGYDDALMVLNKHLQEVTE